MIRINALAFLFIIELVFIATGVAIFLFTRYRKQVLKEAALREEIQKKDDIIEEQQRCVIELSTLQDMFNNLKEKFRSIQEVNTRLKESIKALMPEAEKSQELEKIIADFEYTNKELDLCVGVLQEENERLQKEIANLKEGARSLSNKLQDSVSREEYEMVVQERDGLIKKVERLEDELITRIKDFETLKENYSMLEKEYNALYNNMMTRGS